MSDKLTRQELKELFRFDELLSESSFSSFIDSVLNLEDDLPLGATGGTGATGATGPTGQATSSRVHFYKSTSSSTQDLNVTGVQILPFTLEQINEENDIFETFGDGVRFKKDSSIVADVVLVAQEISGTNARLQVSTRFRINDVPVGPEDYTMYVRDGTGHRNSSSKNSVYFPNISEGDILTVEVERTSTVSTAGITRPRLSDTFLQVVAYEQIIGDEPVIVHPSNNTNISFTNGIVEEYQALAINNAATWQITPTIPGITINPGGLINYDGTDNVSTNSTTITAFNGIGQDSHSINIEIVQNPFLVPGYNGHWRANDINLDENSFVSLIPDVSGNNNVLSNLIVSQQPILTIKNNEKSVLFDGLDDQLNLGGLTINSSTNSQCLILVCKTQTQSDGVGISFGFNGTKGLIMIESDGSCSGSIGGTSPGDVSLPGPFNDGNYHVFTLISDNQTTNTLRIRVDGEHFNQIPLSENIPTIDSISLGARTDGTEQLEMSFVEGVFYSEILTDGEITDIENYMKDEYGI